MRPTNSIQYAKGIFLLLAISLFSTALWAQTAPPIQWKKSLGGTSVDFGEAILNTPDGGYILAGMAGSQDIDIVGNHGTNVNAQDFWIVRLDSNGTVIWKKCYGGKWGERASCITPTRDGGYIVGGTTGGADGDVTKFRTNPNNTSNDIWVIKISATGTLIWEKSYGGIGIESAKKIIQVSDGGYVFLGYTDSNDDDASGNHGLTDAWVVRIDSLGAIKWQKCLGGSDGDSGEDMILTENDGLMILANTNSKDGNVNKLRDSSDVWVVKMDSTGNVLWNKTYGGSRGEAGYSIIKNVTDGYVFAGSAVSADGDVSTANKGQSDVWIVGIDDTGKVLWDKSFGGSRYENAYRILQTPDSGFVVGCHTGSNDKDVSVSKGGTDWWILRLDKNHNMKWEKSFGSLGTDRVNGMVLAKDGYVLMGWMGDNSGDHASIYKGKIDWVVIKLKENFKPTDIEETIQNVDIKVYPSPTSGIVHIDLPKGYEKAEVKVYDMMGKVLQVSATKHGTKRTVDLSGFPSGTYTIQVMYNGQQQSYKVVNQQ